MIGQYVFLFSTIVQLLVFTVIANSLVHLIVDTEVAINIEHLLLNQITTT
jgi:hypothetical protein